MLNIQTHLYICPMTQIDVYSQRFHFFDFCYTIQSESIYRLAFFMPYILILNIKIYLCTYKTHKSMDISKVIRDCRKTERSNYKPLKQKELAEKAGINVCHLSLIEKGVKTPSINTIKKLSEAMGIKLPLLMALSISESDIPDSKLNHYNNSLPVFREMIKSYM